MGVCYAHHAWFELGRLLVADDACKPDGDVESRACGGAWEVDRRVCELASVGHGG